MRSGLKGHQECVEWRGTAAHDAQTVSEQRILLLLCLGEDV